VTVSDGTDLGDVSGNYLQMMRERGWNFADLADEFDRQAQQPSLDGGVGAQRMARWARSQQEAADRRAAAEPDQPVDPRPPADAPQRTAVPPRAPRRG
jgi:hypothetical protein